MRAAAAIVLALALAPPARAADDAAAPEAREAVRRGRAHFQLQEYDAAIAAWKEAWRLRPAPSLLFNIAQAERLAGRAAESKRAYEAFLRDAPDAPNRGEVEEQLTRLDETLRLEALARTTPAVPAGALAPPAAPRAATPDSPPRLRPWVVAGAAAAGALAIGGGAAYLSARAGWSEATAQERPRAEVDRRLAAADGAWRWSIGLSAAALATGVAALAAWAAE